MTSRRTVLKMGAIAALPGVVIAAENMPSLLPDASSRFVETNGIRMHYVEQGSGPLVLLCHGFPECWYSWRHQIAALASAGYRVIAPDLRGYGKSDSPKDVGSYTIVHIANDLVGLLDAIGEKSAVIVGHDFGAVLSWNACLLYPDRFKAVAALSVPYSPRRDEAPMETFRKLVRGNFFYILYFQQAGVADEELNRQPDRSLRSIYYSLSAEGDVARPQYRIPAGTTQWLDTLIDSGRNPSWLSQSDFAYFESPRELRRLQPLRRWSHEQEIKQVFPGSPRTRCAHGARAPWRVPIVMGRH